MSVECIRCRMVVRASCKSDEAEEACEAMRKEAFVILGAYMKNADRGESSEGCEGFVRTRLQS